MYSYFDCCHGRSFMYFCFCLVLFLLSIDLKIDRQLHALCVCMFSYMKSGPRASRREKATHFSNILEICTPIKAACYLQTGVVLSNH